MSTKIEWTNVTVNPFPGCKKVSPGCQNCYAEKMARRLKGMGQTKYDDVVDENGWTGQVGCDLDAMKVPGKGKMVFCQSMGDLFYEGIIPPLIDVAIHEMFDQPQHRFQILTKRPQRAAEYAEYHGGFPDNVWLGVTAENQEWADKRIPVLLQIPAAVRFISLEPLLGPIDLNLATQCDRNCQEYSDAECPGSAGLCVMQRRLDWVIVGPETGPGRRPCDNDWIKSIVDHCHASGVPVFIKAAPDGKGITKDINRIADLLGYPPEQLRQFPRSKS